MTLSQIDFALKGWRWQIIAAATKEPEGPPYRYLGRCLNRVFWLNQQAGDYAFTLRPVRSPE
jgi:hypothetical protein